MTDGRGGTPPTRSALEAALEATWPPAETADIQGWRARFARGAGRRVCSARMIGASADLGALPEIEAYYTARQADCLIQTPTSDAAAAIALGNGLSAQGYAAEASTRFLSASAEPVAARALTTDARPYLIRCRAPLAATEAIWAEGGVGPERRAVMARAAERQIWIVRLDHRVAGAAFVARAGEVAMVHAVQVTPWARRRGAGRDLTIAAARWAQERGARHLALAVEVENAPARALYQGLGFEDAGGYVYWRKKPA